MNPDNLVFPKGSKHKIVKGLLKDGITIPYVVEMGVLNRLIKKYPNVDFWLKFSLKFKLNSLKWLQTSDGRQVLDRAYTLFTLDWKPKEYIVESGAKIGNDYVVSSKPTLKDILK